jgi:hypothetical protein
MGAYERIMKKIQKLAREAKQTKDLGEWQVSDTEWNHVRLDIVLSMQKLDLAEITRIQVASEFLDRVMASAETIAMRQQYTRDF